METAFAIFGFLITTIFVIAIVSIFIVEYEMMKPWEKISMLIFMAAISMIFINLGIEDCCI